MFDYLCLSVNILLYYYFDKVFICCVIMYLYIVMDIQVAV